MTGSAQEIKRQLLKSSQMLTTTGAVNVDKFPEVNKLFEKAISFRKLNERIAACRICAEFKWRDRDNSAPGYGDVNADIFFVGQSLCTKCVTTGIPFIDGSGYYLDIALHLSGLKRKDVFITNVVHCHPPGNRKSLESEIQNCIGFLFQEIMLVKPKAVICLGVDAKKAVEQLFADKEMEDLSNVFYIKHPASYLYSGTQLVAEWCISLSLLLDKIKEM